MSKEIKLKRCPFCGTFPRLENLGNMHRLWCNQCGFIRHGLNKYKMARWWNKRAEVERG